MAQHAVYYFKSALNLARSYLCHETYIQKDEKGKNCARTFKQVWWRCSYIKVQKEERPPALFWLRRVVTQLHLNMYQHRLWISPWNSHLNKGFLIFCQNNALDLSSFWTEALTSCSTSRFTRLEIIFTKNTVLRVGLFSLSSRTSSVRMKTCRRCCWTSCMLNTFTQGTRSAAWSKSFSPDSSDCTQRSRTCCYI